MVPSLKMFPISIVFSTWKGPLHFGHRSPGHGHVNVGELGGEMLPGNDAAQVITLPVGSGDVNPLAKGEIGDHGDLAGRGQVYRAEEPGFHAGVLFHLLPVGRAELSHPVPELFFMEHLVAPDQSHDRPVIGPSEAGI